MRKLFFAALFLCPLFSRAQNLIPNGSFEQNCGTNNLPIAWGCPSFSTSCVPGWKLANGSPGLIFSGAPDGNTYVELLSQVQSPNNLNQCVAEGIYASFTEPLVANHKYNFCMWYKTSDSPQFGFQIIVANTILPTAGSYCLSSYPAIGYQSTIYYDQYNEPDWKHIQISFTPNFAFTKILVFPVCQGAGPFDSFTRKLSVDGLSLSDATLCEGNLDIDLTDPQPSGFYQKGEYIRAGSNLITPGNITPVIADPNVSTTFRVGKYSELKDNFYSSPVNGKYFLVEAFDCHCPASDWIEQRIPQDAEITPGFTEDSVSIVKIFPNPGAGLFTIEKTDPSDAEVEVLDLYGRRLAAVKMTGGRKELDLLVQPSGIYLVRVLTAKQIQVLRIIKQ